MPREKHIIAYKNSASDFSYIDIDVEKQKFHKLYLQDISWETGGASMGAATRYLQMRFDGTEGTLGLGKVQYQGNDLGGGYPVLVRDPTAADNVTTFTQEGFGMKLFDSDADLRIGKTRIQFSRPDGGTVSFRTLYLHFVAICLYDD